MLVPLMSDVGIFINSMGWLVIPAFSLGSLLFLYLWGVMMFSFESHPTTNKWTEPLPMIGFMAVLGLIIAALMAIGIL